MSSTQKATANTATVPSFLVYPVPSIADNSFLQLIFREKVKRSLFFGFGRSRMAIVDLINAEVAQEVEKVLQRSVVATNAGYESTPTKGSTRVELGKVEKPADTQAQQQQNVVTADVDTMTLADMFAPPAAKQAGKTIESAAVPSAALTAVNSSSDFTHLPFLVFRGRPVHVVVSGVRVNDFYTSGGAVPEKHENKDDRSSSKKKLKRSNAAAAGESRGTEADANNDQQPTPSAKSVAMGQFPKNACQKCGSLDHFTRHCAVSGTPAATTTSTAETTAMATIHNEIFATSAAAVTHKKFPKDCCQRCGSPNHFTRHCDGSGVPAQSTPTAATAEDAAPAKKARREETETQLSSNTENEGKVSAETAAPAKSRWAPIQRTSKDQCRFCGSDAHLSRHCPKK